MARSMVRTSESAAGVDMAPPAARPAPASSAAPVPTSTLVPAPAPTSVDDRLIGDDVLVEDVSIDGMCGVY
jgi:mycofactocin precursor